MSLKLGNQTISGSSTSTIKNAKHLLEPFWSDCILNDLSCLRADTFSWQSGTVYSSAYNHLLNDIQGKEPHYVGNVRYGFEPSAFTLAGSATITNGILSNLSSSYSPSNYAYIPVDSLGTGTWELVLKINTGTVTSSSKGILNFAPGPSTDMCMKMRIDTSGIDVLMSSAMSTWDLNKSNAFPINSSNVDCWLKIYYNGSTHVFSYSYDGVNYTTSYTGGNFKQYDSNCKLYLGRDSSTGFSDGTIDLKGSYLKVGDTYISPKIYGADFTYYVADDGHRICLDSEHSYVENLYENTGIAWYYLLDTTNTRFKLPRTKFGFTGFRGDVGSSVEAGLPNITGSHAGVYNSDGLSGAFVNSTYASDHTYLSTNWVDNTINASAKYNFDASDSNIIYGNSDTVQPPATQMYLYFYVGEFSTSAIEQTAGITSEEMANKVSRQGDTMTGDITIDANLPLYAGKSPTLDVTSTTAPADTINGAILQTRDKNNSYVSNFLTVHTTSNEFAQGLDLRRMISGSTYNANMGIIINSSGNSYAYASDGVRESIAGWSFASSRVDTITISTSGTQYQAPAHGYFYYIGTNSGAGNCYAQLANVTSSYTQQNQMVGTQYGTICLVVPALKGEKVTLNYSNTSGSFYFIYAVCV